MQAQLNEIHRRFRLAMNGVVSSSMRSKGMPYKVNFGVSLPQLKQIAAQYQPDSALARALWEEDIRESRLLATFLQPHEGFTKAEALQWAEEADTPELADFLCMNLLQYLPYAPELADTLIGKEDAQNKRKGYHLSGRLFAKQTPLTSTWLDDFLRRAANDLSSESRLLSFSVLEALKQAVRNENRAQMVFSFFDTHHPLHEELQFEYNYYGRRFSDMEE